MELLTVKCQNVLNVNIGMYLKLIVEKMEMKEKKKMPKYWEFDDIDDDSKGAV